VLVTTLATETIPETVGAGVTLLRDQGPATAAASDAVVERADSLQYELGEGPCLSAGREGEPFRIDDTRTETRWPRWTEAVAPLGMRSAMTTPMLVSGAPIGAIKVYSREPSAYDERDARVLALFAAQAAILLANMQSHENATRLTDELKAAVRSRDVIGMAKGVLMVSRGIDEAAAFTILAQTAERSDQALREVAQGMLDHPRRGEG
jgi:GAF domain-containing protein